MSRYDIIYIGTAIVDSIIRGFDPNPVSATGFVAGSGTLNIGGEAVNGAIAAAKLGMKTGILCYLGSDPAGSMIEAELARQGVDTGLIVRSCEHATPVTTMFVAEDGSRKSITNGSHRYNFHPEQYEDRFCDARALVLGSLFRAPFDDPGIIRRIVETAHARGIKVFADTKLPNFAKIKLADISDSLPMIDFITPNEDEGRFYTGQDDPEKMADVFLDAGVRNVIIKLGARGCLFKNREEMISLPAYEIDALDATGAGDNFLSGFASKIISGSDAGSALVFANACGAVCASEIGACTALKNSEQIQEFINQYERRGK
ncbi:MAG: carbohydrate kinase family protein [Clostridiales bacterium]|nr:carbohydrate kinase family protein [Clostridiales bacterium]